MSNGAKDVDADKSIKFAFKAVESFFKVVSWFLITCGFAYIAQKCSINDSARVMAQIMYFLCAIILVTFFIALCVYLIFRPQQKFINSSGISVVIIAGVLVGIVWIVIGQELFSAIPNLMREYSSALGENNCKKTI